MRFLLCWLIFIEVIVCQEKPEDWPYSYNIGPYKHVYPPTNLSIDQLSCVPEMSTNKTCPLFIQLIMSFGGAFTSSGVVPGIQVALDQINANPDLLPGYTLHYTLQDSQCMHTTSLDVLFHGLLEPPTKIAVIGSGCSVATEPTAEISHYYNLTQLSCSSSSTELMNRKRFPRHFQLSTADISLAYGFFGVIQDAKWKKVTIVLEDENLFTITMNELKRLLTATNIEFDEIRYEPPINPFLVDPDSRIYVLSMYPEFARQILCRAYNKRNDFHYPRAQFFVNGWYPDKWWEGSPDEQVELEKNYDGCTVDHRKSLVEYIIGVSTSGRVVLNYSTVADNGYTGEEVQMAYERYIKASYLNVTELFLYQLCYDTVWTLARALNKTLYDIETDEELRKDLNISNITNNSQHGLQHFTYSNSILLENIFMHLTETNFDGIVGNISFNENGSRRIDTVELGQYRFSTNNTNLSLLSVGTVFRISDLEFDVRYLDGRAYIWPDGVPYDGVATNRTVSIHISVTIIFSVLATAGIVFAFICLILNLVFRKKKVIKLTSPYLNCLIVTGAVILYINMYIYVTPSVTMTTETWLCNFDSWLTAIGYSFCYGTILAKMCRVYYIFNNPTLKKKKPIKDWTLACGVAFLVIIDVVILTVYSLVEGLRRRLFSQRVPNQENVEDIVGILEETYRYFVLVCNSESRSITLGILYGYKALLQIVALVFAVSIRKVQIKGLNNTVYIIAAIYVTSIVTTVIIVSTYTLVELVNVYAVVFSMCLFIGTTVILVLVFVPSLVIVYKDPEGNSVFNDNVSATTTHKTDMYAVQHESELTSLRKRVKDLEVELKETRTKNES